MTEYIILAAPAAIISNAVFAKLGGVYRSQVSAVPHELAGNFAKDAIQLTKNTAGDAARTG